MSPIAARPAPRTALAGLLIFVAPAALADTWLVTPDGTGDVPTIGDALEAAATGDVIELADGVFTGPGNRDLDLLGKGVTIRSQSGDAAACIIDCQGSADEPHRGFIFQSLEGPDARLEHLTVRHGWAEGPDTINDGTGGAILVKEGATPTFTGLVLRDNTAMSGGAIFVLQAAPTVTACHFLDNTAWWGSGGALNLYHADIEAPIADCVFRGNAAHQTGGAVASAQCDFALERCLFEANTVNSYGAGFECYANTRCTLTDCTFAENIASESGGGAMVWGIDTECTFERCTFAANRAGYGACGITVDQAVATVRNTIVAFGHGPSVQVLNGATMALQCCDIFGNDGGDWVAAIADQADDTGNLSADPLFCGDQAPETPYALHADSPCAPDHYPCLQIGAWPVGCSAVTAADSELPDLDGPRLLPVTPNPFNPRTTVTFTLPRAAQLELCVYDTRGRQVAVLATGECAAGETILEWDGRDTAGRDMPSGTYLVMLKTRDGQQVQKGVLVR